ncbi:TonB-dependent receptor domain-containing protein [Pasteurella sp. PK-2025]|uniref:TonB-dependent receptor domain-containing protein n=1 Tax=Pasteurella sp. PK-2025 TaxID=3413133 RepID=UPI003C719E49
MNKSRKGLGFILPFILPFVAYAETTELEVISVETEAFKPKDKVFLKQAASSTRTNFDTATQSLDTVLRSVPGAFTQIDKSSGTVSVNVRGGTGFGRVNSMIDGVSQTFYASSADGGSRSSSTSQFGNLIDPGFLNSVDIDRGSFEGSSGANTLLGSANFKTIGVKDLVAEGRQIGFMGKYLWGSNATEPQVLGAVAFKRDFGNARWFGLLYGFSERHLSQDYRIGGGRKVTESSIDLTNLDEDDREQTDTSPFDAKHVRQRPVSHIAKLEYGDRYQQSTLSYREYQTRVGGRAIQNHNYQANYHFALPDSKWLDFNFLVARNVSSQHYAAGARIIGKPLLAPLSVSNTADTFDINNTFHLDLPLNVGLKTRVGFTTLQSRYFKNRDPSEELNINREEDEDPYDFECFGLGCVRKSLGKATFQPNGRQNIITFYVDNTLSWNILSLDYNVNLSRYRLNGERLKYLPFYLSETESEISSLYRKISREKDAATRDELRQKVRELQSKLDYVKQHNCHTSYDEDLDEEVEQCREVNFTLPDQSAGKMYNYSATLSANIHDLFTPFVSYSKSHRAPNIREVFFSSVSDYGVNTHLRPEKAKVVQLGVNGYQEKVFTGKDKLGYKVVYYHTRVKDFIYNSDNRQPLVAGRIKYLNDTNILHKNYQQPVKMTGVEAEVNYDMGNLYFNLAYARQKNNQPVSFTDGSSRGAGASETERLLQGFGASKISVLPKDYGSLEIGTRFFDGKLDISGTAKYYGKSKRVLSKPLSIKSGDARDTVKERIRVTQDIPKQPIIFDLQVSYEPIKNLVLKAEMQNVFDKRYMNPLDANNDSASQSVYNIDLSDKTINVFNNFARGRTYVFTLSYKY